MRIPQPVPARWWLVWHLCAGRWLTPTLRHHLFPLTDFSGTFPHKLTGTIAFLALLHPFSPDSFRYKTGKENHPQANQVVAPHTTRCPSATNYLLLAVTLPRAKRQSFPPVPAHPLLKSTLTSSGSWQTTASCWVQESVPVSPLASPPRDTEAGCAGKEVPTPSAPQTQHGRTVQELRLFQKQKIRAHTW